MPSISRPPLCLAVVTDPGSLALIGLAGLAYLAGGRRWARRVGRPVVSPAQQGAFAAGLMVAAVAVASPLDGLAERSLTIHMVQHVLLLNACGPLFALGAPLPAMLWALPDGPRARAVRFSRRMTRNHDRWQAGWIAGGLVLEAGVLLGWHVPALYEAALRNAGVHNLEHLTFVLTSTLSWWTVVSGRRSRRGAAAVAALIGSLSGIVLGSAMVIAPNPFYPTYVQASVAGALADQRMAGVVMWAFGGLLEDLTGAALFASWLASSRERPEEAYVIPPLPGVAG
jgi:cytochrome c oxidase assembly factor CtaG